MAHKQATQRPHTPQPADALPFGSDPRRSRAPVMVLGIAFALWTLFLVWMAAEQSGWL